MVGGEGISWGRGRSDGASGQAATGLDLAALDRIIGWQADTEGRLRESIFFESQRIEDKGGASPIIRCVFTRTTVDSDFLQWSERDNNFSVYIDTLLNTVWSGLDVRIAGYLRVGSTSVPSDTTAGDLTATRAHIGDNNIAALPTDVQLFGDFTATGLFQINTSAVQRFQVAAATVQVGVDGSAPQFVLAARDGTDEGGEMQFNGANLNSDWVLDNNAGNMRLFVGSTVYHDFSTTYLRSAGYARVGSVAAPSNTTVGDLQVIRLNVGVDSALINGTRLSLNIDSHVPVTTETIGLVDVITAPGTGFASTSAAWEIDHHVQPTASVSGQFWGLVASAYHDAGAFNLTDDNALVGCEGTAVQWVAATTVKVAQGIRASIRPVTGTITSSFAVRAVPGGAGSDTGTITTAWGLYVDNKIAGVTVTTLVGLEIEALSGATTIFGIRNRSNSVQTGYARVGAITAPTNTTDGDLTFIRGFVNDDTNFSLQIVSLNPRILLDSGDYLEWNRANNALTLAIGSAAPATCRIEIDSRGQTGASAVLYFYGPNSAFAGPSWWRQAATDTRLKWGLEHPNENTQDPDLVLYRWTGGAGAEVRNEFMRFFNDGTLIRVGIDGSAPALVLTAIDGTNEGGELRINGAAANTDWIIDNNAGSIRLFSGVTVYHQWNNAFFVTAGYERVGSVSLPTNQTAGDLTCARLSVGNVAFLGGAASLARVNGISDFDARRTRVFNAGSITVTTSTWTTITLDSERFDNDTLHSTVSNTGRLTATVAGTYLIIGNISFDANATGTRIARIFLNGVTEIALVSVPAVATGAVGTAIIVTTLWVMAATDYVELQGWQNSGGDLAALSSDAYGNEFSMIRVGDS